LNPIIFMKWAVLALVVLVLVTSGCVRDSGELQPGVCGNGLCEDNETKAGCAQDCDKVECDPIYAEMEQQCLDNGWSKLHLDVDGMDRELLWKAPEKWENGAVIFMHGGGGSDSNICSHLPKSGMFSILSEIYRGVPLNDFGELAVEEGFAVFSLDSEYNGVTDSNGLSVGKRWDSLEMERENIDLPFLEKLLTETIPGMRPEGSSVSIFVTGISNGGFMTILASTHFSDKVTAFAPVSAGDPYGTYFDMATHPKNERKCSPGVWRDIETGLRLDTEGACESDSYPGELEWPATNEAIPFKQFHGTGDGACDISCMHKVNKMLVEKGYKDEGAFILESEKRSPENHFWQGQYNQPMLDFFKKHA
jgi:hypothetical protein